MDWSNHSCSLEVSIQHLYQMYVSVLPHALGSTLAWSCYDLM